MASVINLEGKIFNRLKVLKRVENNKRGQAQWLCECSCGNRIITTGSRLLNGDCQSCGCLAKDNFHKLITKHGFHGERLYTVWKGMRGRCNNPNNRGYPHYGGRGIKVCDEWNDYLNFRNFMFSIGYDPLAPKGKQTIERINVDGDYCPENCTLKTWKEQGYNKTNNHRVMYNGNFISIAELCDILNVDSSVIYKRINDYGYTVEEAFEKEVSHKVRRDARRYTVKGKSYTCKEWAAIIGMNYGTLKKKLIKNGHDMKKIVMEYESKLREYKDKTF